HRARQVHRGSRDRTQYWLPAHLSPPGLRGILTSLLDGRGAPGRFDQPNRQSDIVADQPGLRPTTWRSSTNEHLEVIGLLGAGRERGPGISLLISRMEDGLAMPL